MARDEEAAGAAAPAGRVDRGKARRTDVLLILLLECPLVCVGAFGDGRKEPKRLHRWRLEAKGECEVQE